MQTIVWNKTTGHIVGGHQTVKVLKDLGHSEAVTTIVELGLEQEKALNIALNKISGDWDEYKLRELLDDLSTGSIDVSVTGFDTDEIEEMVEEYNMMDAEEDDFGMEETLNQVEEEPVSRLGDLWLLGDHKLLCGDATLGTDIDNLMGGAKGDLIITDPPYNVDYESSAGLTIQNDNMSDEEFYFFLLDSYKQMFGHVKEGAPAYIFHADSEGVNFRKAFMDAGFKLSECLIWVKNALVLGRQDYHWRHEPIIYGWKPGAAHPWYGKRDKNTVLEDEEGISKLSKQELVDLVMELTEKTPQTVIHFNKPSRSGEHPTMKPLGLIGILLQNSSRRGDIILDPFGGSGSTMIASDQLDRHCYMVELDPIYCDVIVQRYINHKGTDEDVFLVRNGNKYSFGDTKGDCYG